MLFPLQVLSRRSAVSVRTAITNAMQKYPKHTCPQCGVNLTIMDSITFSLIADRATYSRRFRDRTKVTTPLAIILSAMAVETAVTQVFIEMEGNEHYGKTGSLNPTQG